MAVMWCTPQTATIVTMYMYIYTEHVCPCHERKRGRKRGIKEVFSERGSEIKHMMSKNGRSRPFILIQLNVTAMYCAYMYVDIQILRDSTLHVAGLYTCMHVE